MSLWSRHESRSGENHEPTSQENCILELFRLDDAAAYRAGYVCIRQLALVLRNASLKPVAAAKGATGKAKAKSKAATKGNKASKVNKVAKVAKGKAKAKSKIAEALVSWPYVRAMFLWTRLVSEVKVSERLGISTVYGHFGSCEESELAELCAFLPAWATCIE